jgi:hypothetical protein
MKYFGLFSIIFLLISCNGKSSIEKEIEAIPMDIEILRFDKEFAEAEISDLPELKKNTLFSFRNNSTIVFGKAV